MVKGFKARSQNCENLRHVCPSIRPSTWNNTIPTAQILIKFKIKFFFRKYAEKI